MRAFEDELCEHIIVMVQKEVAIKFTAKVNDKEYSSLGIITETISKDSKILFDVPPEAFDPMPKVTSSILYIKKIYQRKLIKILISFKSMFCTTSKETFKNLSSIIEKSKISTIFEELNLNDNLRPHEVNASLYSQMYTKVKMEEIIKNENRQENTEIVAMAEQNPNKNLLLKKRKPKPKFINKDIPTNGEGWTNDLKRAYIVNEKFIKID